MSPSPVLDHPVESPPCTTDPDGPPEGGSELISEQDFPIPGRSESSVASSSVRGATPPCAPDPCPPPRTTLVEDSGVERVFDEPTKPIDIEKVVHDLTESISQRLAAGVEEDRMAAVSDRLLD